MGKQARRGTCGACQHYQRRWEGTKWPDGIPPKRHTLHHYGWCLTKSRHTNERSQIGGLDNCYTEDDRRTSPDEDENG